VRLVTVEFRKWAGDLHWHYPTYELGHDEHGVWLGARAGTPIRRGSEPVKHARGDFVTLIPERTWWSAVWNDPVDDGIRVYVDVATPGEWDGDTVRMIDLDLDVIRRADGTVQIADEDEFEEHRVAYGYPERVVDTARATTAETYLALERRQEPFGGAGDAWLSQARFLPRFDDHPAWGTPGLA
jgi:protein associated with RNAse G/E